PGRGGPGGRCPAPRPPLARRPRRTTSTCRRRGWRRFSCEPLEVGEPDLDERPHAVLEAGLPRDGERLLVGLPDLRRVDALLQPVVTGDEQLLDPLPCLAALHRPRLPPSLVLYHPVLHAPPPFH